MTCGPIEVASLVLNYATDGITTVRLASEVVKGGERLRSRRSRGNNSDDEAERDGDLCHS
jgi:hypothetical protein